MTSTRPNRRSSLLVALCSALLAVGANTAHAHKAKRDSAVRIVVPESGSHLKNPVKLVFEAERIEINPVGVKKHKSGHVILLINTDIPDESEPVAMDDQHVHFMNGEREAEIELPPGENRLQILLGDEEHELFQEWLVSDPVTIFVE